MFGADPSTLQHIPRSEFIKRRAYWQMWKKANQPDSGDGEQPHPSIPGVTISGSDAPPDGVVLDM